jgi:hypothetical protein
MKSCERAKARLSAKAIWQSRGWAWKLPQDPAGAARAEAQPAAPPWPGFGVGQVFMGQGTERLTGFAQPRVVHLWSRTGKKRA